MAEGEVVVATNRRPPRASGRPTDARQGQVGEGPDIDIGERETAERGPRVVGRLRRYLKAGEGREFDVTTTATPEGRLVDPSSPSWSMPSGDEPHMRRRSRLRARDVRAGDVGRFKLTDFTTRATDERGHDKSLKISMPEQMRNELTAICDAKIFPARNAESLARTLIAEGLELLHEIARQHNLYIPNSHMQQLDALATLNRNMLATLAYDDMLEESCKFIHQLMDAGIANKARTAVYETLAIVEGIESRELRDKWTKRMHREFGSVMRGRPAMLQIKKRASDTSSEHEHEHDQD